MTGVVIRADVYGKCDRDNNVGVTPTACRPNAYDANSHPGHQTRLECWKAIRRG
jgi:hypothetical protein